MPINGANLGLNSESGPSMILELPSMDCLATEVRLQLGRGFESLDANAVQY